MKIIRIMKIREIVASVLASGLIGAAVAFPVIMITGSDYSAFLPLSAFVGTVIGLASRLVFMLFFTMLGEHPIPAFLSVAAVIALGTVAGSIVLGTRSVPLILAMTCAALLTGLIMTFVLYRYYVRLNERLRETKGNYSEEP